MKYEIGKVYQADGEYNSLFEILEEKDNGLFEVGCVNGAWEGLYDSVKETLYIYVTKMTRGNFVLVKPYADIGYGYMDQEFKEED